MLILMGYAKNSDKDLSEEEKAENAMEAFRANSRHIDSYLQASYGYVVFPSIGKGAMGLGGAHVKVIVSEKGRIIGTARMTQITWGLLWGGQAYSDVIFFYDEGSLNAFKENSFEFSGQVSAVAARHGASADIPYKDGVAVYTIARGGLMCEAAIGGQKFRFKPLKSESTEKMDSTGIE